MHQPRSFLIFFGQVSLPFFSFFISQKVRKKFQKHSAVKIRKHFFLILSSVERARAREFRARQHATKNHHKLCKKKKHK